MLIGWSIRNVGESKVSSRKCLPGVRVRVRAPTDVSTFLREGWGVCVRACAHARMREYARTERAGVPDKLVEQPRDRFGLGAVYVVLDALLVQEPAHRSHARHGTARHGTGQPRRTTRLTTRSQPESSRRLSCWRCLLACLFAWKNLMVQSGSPPCLFRVEVSGQLEAEFLLEARDHRHALEWWRAVDDDLAPASAVRVVLEDIRARDLPQSKPA